MDGAQHRRGSRIAALIAVAAMLSVVTLRLRRELAEAPLPETAAEGALDAARARNDQLAGDLGRARASAAAI